MKNSFEDLFKNKFTEYRIEAPPNMWLKTTTRLKNMILKRIITSVVITTVLAVSVVAFVILKSDKKESTLKSQNSVFEINNRKIVKNILHEDELINDVSEQNEKKYKQDVIYISVNDDLNKKDEINIIPKISKIQDSNKVVGFSLSKKEGCSPMKIILTDKGESGKLKWKINGKTYMNKNLVVSFSKPGVYSIVLERVENGQKRIFTDSVRVYESPKADFLIPKEVFINKQIILENNSTDAINYRWFIGNTFVSEAENLIYNFDKKQKAKIKLIVQNSNNCIDTIEQTINVKKQEEYIIYPTAFSPNIYGPSGGYYNTNSQFVNEIFRPYIFEKKVEEYHLKIYNKYGKLIFETIEVEKGWDGYFENKLVPVEVYVYVVKGKFDDGEIFMKQGNVTVLYNK